MENSNLSTLIFYLDQCLRFATLCAETDHKTARTFFDNAFGAVSLYCFMTYKEHGDWETLAKSLWEDYKAKFEEVMYH